MIMKRLFYFNASDRAVVATLVTVIAIAAMVLFFTSCSTEEPTLPPLEPAETNIYVKADTAYLKEVTITFQCRGFDITTASFSDADQTTPRSALPLCSAKNPSYSGGETSTRAELKADGKTLTDLWVLDYVDGTLARSVIHQTSDQEDFGTPTLNLAVGSHHVYFIASRGQDATIDTDAHTIAFAKVLDTFYYDLALDVTATSSGSRNVTLERCVTKFTAVITDAIPEGAATFNMTPAQWYYGWDYVAGTPTTATASQTITINIPSSEIGATNERLSIFGFSAATEWMTDIAINCKKGDGTILGTATISDVPVKQNRITTFSGPLFSANGLTSVSLSSDWLDEHTGTW